MDKIIRMLSAFLALTIVLAVCPAFAEEHGDAYYRIKAAVEGTSAQDEATGRIERWVSDITGDSEMSLGTREIGSTNYGYVVFFQPYAVEAGYGFGDGVLHRYAALNQAGFDPLTRETTPATFAQRFSMAGELLEFLRTNKAEIVVDLSVTYSDADISPSDKYTIWIGLSNDDDTFTYFLEYDLMTNEYKMYTYQK